MRAPATGLITLDGPVDEARHGGMAAQLARALGQGLPVPRGLALAFDFVDGIVARDAAAAAALSDAVRVLPPVLAVRSSAIGAGGESARHTELGVGAGAVVEAVRAVRGSTRRHARVGVVVQGLVDADVAGVLRTRNPLDGADERVIEAAWGLGAVVADGRVTPDRYRIGRDGRVRERSPGDKPLALYRRGAAVVEEPLDDALAAALCLDDARLSALHALAERCERVFGGTQELEWAFAGETPWLLERRAIPVLASGA